MHDAQENAGRKCEVRSSRRTNGRGLSGKLEARAPPPDEWVLCGHR
jgi:hypothetical protein